MVLGLIRATSSMWLHLLATFSLCQDFLFIQKGGGQGFLAESTIA